MSFYLSILTRVFRCSLSGMGAAWCDFNTHFQNTMNHTLNTRFNILQSVDIIAVLSALSGLQMKHTDMTSDFQNTVCSTLRDQLSHINELEAAEILKM